MNQFFEFQSKGSHAPEFKLKHPDFNSITPETKIKMFRDGERIIGKLIHEEKLGSKTFYHIEDTEGNTTSLSSFNFHKISEPKNFSKKFIFFKQVNKIID